MAPLAVEGDRTDLPGRSQSSGGPSGGEASRAGVPVRASDAECPGKRAWM